MKYIKLGLLSICLLAILSVISVERAEAATCTKTWNGSNYSYNYSSAGSNGTFVFGNWAGTGYNITISVLGKVTTCLNQADFNKMMSWSYNSDAYAFWNTGLSSWSRSLSCGNTHSYSKVHVPINGSCGSSNGGTYSSAPTNGLCSTGTASAVSTGPSTYTWSCAGQYSGTNATCSANIATQGSTTTPPVQGGGGQGGGGEGDGPLSASCLIDDTLPNLGQEVILNAVTSGGAGNYSYSWGGGVTANENSASVTKSSPDIVNATLSVTRGSETKSAICAQIVFMARPVITIVPPITDAQCKLDWNDAGFPSDITCSVYADGALTTYTKNSNVDAGKKYQVKCTYTIGGVPTTTASEIRACVKNPSLIEI